MEPEMLALRARVLALEAALVTFMCEFEARGLLDAPTLARLRGNALDFVEHIGPPPHRVRVPEEIVGVAADLVGVVFTSRVRARPANDH